MASEFLTEKEKKTLELDVRRSLYRVVRKHPGSHFREIERKSNLATGSVQYHLDYLVKHGLLKIEKEGNTSCYFPKDFASENKKLMSLLRQRSLRNILLFIFTHTNCNHEHIVRFVELSPSTVSWHLRKLQSNGIISSHHKGRKTQYTLAVEKKEILTLLITYQESFFDSIVDNIVEMWDTG